MSRSTSKSMSLPTETPAKSRVGQPELIVRCGYQLEGKLMAGSFDQLDEGTKTRITPVGFIRADHRLRDTGASREIGLRQSGATSLTNHRSRLRIHSIRWSGVVACGRGIVRRAGDYPVAHA